MAKKLDVEVHSDYLESLPKNPFTALVELIWNSLDADATEVSISFGRNALEGINFVEVWDNGHGITLQDADNGFSSLGGSWKRLVNVTREKKRKLHGKGGRGRFLAFSLGGKVIWQTHFEKNKKLFEYMIEARSFEPKIASLSDTLEIDNGETFTRVKVTDISPRVTELDSSKTVSKLAKTFAPYLQMYPDITLKFDGTKVTPGELIENDTNYKLEIEDIEEEVRLQIIEWNDSSIERSLVFCDEDGFALHETKPGIQAAGFSFTAYAKSNYFREINKQGLLAAEDFSPTLRSVNDSIRSSMRSHFRRRANEKAKTLVGEWIKEGIYPYEGEATSEIEEAEREVFNVISLSVHDYLPGFESSSNVKNRRLQLELIKQALENGNASLQRIFDDVLGLPKEQQDELADLLEHTSLSHMIRATKLVSDRLRFLQGFEAIVFHPESKKTLRERSQLHKILEQESWLFGEEYHLAVSDKSLKNVLKKHLNLLGRSEVAEEVDEEVFRSDGSRGIVDLMLSRTLARNGRDSREHLIVELKAPRVRIDSKVIQQTQSYAYAIQQDERFRDTKTSWVFIAISNDMDDFARKMSQQSDRPAGVIHTEDNLKVIVRTWGEIIEHAQGRMRFLQEQLNFEPEWEEGLSYLRSKYSNILSNAPLVSSE